MDGWRFHRRLLGALALLAALGVAAMPTLARALAHASGTIALAEVCTPQGARLMAVDGSERAPGAAAPLDLCALCPLAAAAHAAPPAVAAAAPANTRRHERPTLALQAPRPLFAWRAAQPRGPPPALS